MPGGPLTPITKSTSANEQIPSLTYRPEIDGLRAIAVLGVIFFHYRLPNFDGGFVGVDVFFVISGFLITQNILSMKQAGTFTFRNFYLRRARRLFPALFTTISVVLIAGYFIFDPSRFERLGSSSIYAIASLSNFFFLAETGYFDSDAQLKPLLHTWSLSIEEQFYLVWPATLVLLTRARSWITLSFLAGISLLAIAASIETTNMDPARAFYLAPYRVPEFAIGALMVWAVRYPARNPLLSEALVLIGLALIIYPILSFNESTIFPGLAVLVPCLGTALVIYSVNARFSVMLLNNRLLVYIGLLSYSLYLAHWPLIVFYQYVITRPIELSESYLLITVSLFIAFLMYRFIETPFRSPKYRPYSWSASHFGLACTAPAIVLIFIGANIWGQGGWPSRLQPEVRTVFENFRTAALERTAFKVRDRCLAKAESAEIYDNCLKELAESLGTRVLLIGDSHGRDTKNAIEFAYGEEVALLVQQGCNAYPHENIHGIGCFAHLDQYVDKYLNSSDFDLIILASNWAGPIKNIGEQIIPLIQNIEKKGIDVIVFGKTVTFPIAVPDLIFKHGKIDGLDLFVDGFRNREHSAFNKSLREIIVDSSNAQFVDKEALLCPRGVCKALNARKTHTIYLDRAHWTLEGARFVGARLSALHPRLLDSKRD